MKLELKHLVGYLPYGLKVQTNKGLLELTTIKNGEPEYPFWCETFGDFENEDYNYSRLKGYRGRGFAIEDGKPILRPLSDLTKEINGVVHLVSIADLYIKPRKHTINDNKAVSKYGYLEFEISTNRFFEKDGCSELFQPTYSFDMINYLFQHHFDVYGLIEKGLAIDVNMIENV